MEVVGNRGKGGGLHFCDSDSHDSQEIPVIPGRFPGDSCDSRVIPAIPVRFPRFPRDSRDSRDSRVIRAIPMIPESFPGLKYT